MKYFIYLFFVFYAIDLFAATGGRDNLEIRLWHPSSNNRVDSPTYNGITRVYFVGNAAWGDTSCREDSGDIVTEDKNLYAAMLAAFMAGKKVKVEVDDSLPKINNVCKITAIFIYK